MRPEQALRNQVLAFLDRGNIRRAGPAAEQLASQYPNYAPGRAAFSEVWLRCNRPDLACDEAATAHRLAPKSPQLAAHYARCLIVSGEEGRARDAAATALALEPDDHATLDTLGNVFSRLGEQDRALEIFEAALEQAPDNTTASSTSWSRRRTTPRRSGDLGWHDGLLKTP